MEPWCFQLNLTKKYPGNIHTVTDVYLKSTAELNLNITEPFIEVFPLILSFSYLSFENPFKAKIQSTTNALACIYVLLSWVSTLLRMNHNLFNVKVT